MRELEEELGQVGEWHEWIPKTFADGTPMTPDGNPIFDARSNRLQRAVRIIQTPPASADIELAAWLSELDYDDSGEVGHAEELTINCALSDESATMARALIREWMKPETSSREMKAVIRQALADVLT